MSIKIDCARVDPAHCRHENTVFVQTGHMYTFLGEYTDNLNSYEQCLNCGWVRKENEDWGPCLTNEKETPF